MPANNQPHQKISSHTCKTKKNPFSRTREKRPKPVSDAAREVRFGIKKVLL